MAASADHEGFASHCCHKCRPRRLWLSPALGEVGKCADMVDFNDAAVFAHLAPTVEEPIDQLDSTADSRGWFTVDDGRVLLLPQRDAVKLCDQWFPIDAFNNSLEALARPIWCLDGGVVLCR